MSTVCITEMKDVCIGICRLFVFAGVAADASSGDCVAADASSDDCLCFQVLQLMPAVMIVFADTSSGDCVCRHCS